jgi:hypothetical protein
MRVHWIGSALVVAIVAGQAQAADDGGKPLRRTEIISMAAQRQRVTEPAPVSHERAVTAQGPGAFAVHDLSRRWVAFQMADYAAGADTGALTGLAQIESEPPRIVDVPRAAMSTVPAWMRGSQFTPVLPSFQAGCAPAPYRPTGFLKSDAENRRAGLYAMMSSIACEHGLPVDLFDAMIIRESRYRPDAFSAKNAFGLTQLMPGTAAGLGVNRYSIEGNLRGGARYLRQQLDRFGQYHLALAAYNAGPGRVRDGQVPAITETRAYVANVLANWIRLSGSGSPSVTYRRIASAPPARRATVSAF